MVDAACATGWGVEFVCVVRDHLRRHALGRFHRREGTFLVGGGAAGSSACLVSPAPHFPTPSRHARELPTPCGHRSWREAATGSTSSHLPISPPASYLIRVAESRARKAGDSRLIRARAKKNPGPSDPGWVDVRIGKPWLFVKARYMRTVGIPTSHQLEKRLDWHGMTAASGYQRRPSSGPSVAISMPI